MVHPGLAWLRSSTKGRDWLERLPRVIRGCAEEWSLEVGDPYPYASVSLALRVEAPGGRAVLKIQFPHRESEHEAEALRLHDGDGAVRLLAHDASRHALLLERCEPGTPLADAGPDAALDVFIELLPRLWKPAAPPFRSLAEEAAGWADALPDRWRRLGQPFERRLLDAALEAIRELAPTQSEQVLVDQDLHAQNVLRASREPWLAIDPKPLAGERELGVAAIVRGFELGSGRDALRRRLDRLTAELGLDRERARGWALAQTLAWAVDDDGVLPEQVEIARWLLELGAP